MDKYIGTKQIAAKQMNRLEYNEFRGWTLPEDENGSDEGYLVEYLDGGEPNTKEFSGYVSWSPKEQFENAYKQSGNLSFGDAITYMKAGLKVARKGWNGKDMWVTVGKGGNLESGKFWNKHTRAHAESQQDGCAIVDDYIIMKTAFGSICMGWLASQADILANDWEIAQ